MARLRLIILGLAATALLLLAILVMVDRADARPLTMVGTTSWYGGSCDGADNNIPKWSPRDKNRTPGIALRRLDTPGRFFLLTVAGRRAVVQHTDGGPATWAGRLVDTNYRAANALGYPGKCARGFPTDSVAKVTLLTTRRARAWIKKTRTKLDDRLVLPWVGKRHPLHRAWR